MVDPAWIRNPSDELAVRQGCYFDPSKGQFVCDFLETFCKQSKDDWAGKPLRLMDWQRDFLMRLYGWRRADGTRRFRKAYLEVPKKNGKSTLVSGLALYHLLADGVGGPEVYLNAVDKSQAGIVFDECERMVKASPSLSGRLECVPSDKLIVHPEGNGKVQAMSADVPSKDGLNASFTVFDELHRQKNWAMWRVFRYAGRGRKQPLTLSITTAGVDRQSACYSEHEYTKKVNSGLIEDAGHLGVIYGATADEDWKSPEVWRRTNPSIGHTITEEDFASDVKELEGKPGELSEFLRLRLCVWTQAVTRFLPRDKWDACGLKVADAVALQGESCYSGLDLSSTSDLTAYAQLFPAEGGYFDLLMRFWMPENEAARRDRDNNVPYLAWARQGYLTLTPGDVIDYDFVRKAIVDDSKLYPPAKVLADPWNATQLLTKLREDDGLPVEVIRQGFVSLNAPTKELERLVLSGRLRHGNNPVLNWMCDNAVRVKDAAGNVKLDKEKSKEKIDGLSALVNAIAGTLDGDSSLSSKYEDEGLLVL